MSAQLGCGLPARLSMPARYISALNQAFGVTANQMPVMAKQRSPAGFGRPIVCNAKSAMPTAPYLPGWAMINPATGKRP